MLGLLNIKKYENHTQNVYLNPDRCPTEKLL